MISYKLFKKIIHPNRGLMSSYVIWHFICLHFPKATAGAMHIKVITNKMPTNFKTINEAWFGNKTKRANVSPRMQRRQTIYSNDKFVDFLFLCRCMYVQYIILLFKIPSVNLDSHNYKYYVKMNKEQLLV